MSKYTSSNRTPKVIAAFGAMILLAPVTRAQSAADKAWANVVDLAKPVSVPKSIDGNARPKDQVDADIHAQAARLRQAAQAAKDFYTANPGHSQANEARKVEALSAIHGAEADNVTYQEAAMIVGKAFREDKSQAVEDRAEVGLAMEQLDLSLKIKNRKASGRTEDWKKIGDNLRGEFGDTATVQAYYMDIARSAAPDAALALATDVVRSTVASRTTKTKAQGIIDRSALIGKPIALKLTTIDGPTLDLAQQKNKVTVLVAWSPSEPSALSTVKLFEKSLPADAQVVYLAMGGSQGQVKKASASAPLVGIHCHAPAGPLARSANDALKLLYSPIPRVYVLNRAGVLVGFGRIEDLPRLLQPATS